MKTRKSSLMVMCVMWALITFIDVHPVCAVGGDEIEQQDNQSSTKLKLEKEEGDSSLVLQAKAALQEAIQLGIVETETLRGGGYTSLAEAYYQDKRYDKAVVCYQLALSAKEDIAGPDNALLIPTLGNIANIYFNQGKLSEAEVVLKKEIVLMEKAIDADNTGWFGPLFSMAYICKNDERNSEASQYFKRALPYAVNIWGADSSQVGSINMEIGTCLLKQGTNSEAEKYFEECLSIFDRAGIKSNPSLALCLKGMAEIRRSQGLEDEAIKFESRAQNMEE